MSNNYSNTIKEMLNSGEISNDQKIKKTDTNKEISIQQHYKNVSIIKICLIIITSSLILSLVSSLVFVISNKFNFIL
jgi:hypothetical protein